MNDHLEYPSTAALDSLTASIYQVLDKFTASVETSLTEKNLEGADFCGNFGLLLGDLYCELKRNYEVALFQYRWAIFDDDCRCSQIDRITNHFTELKLDGFNKDFADILMSDVDHAQELFLDKFTCDVVSTKEIDVDTGLPWYNINFPDFHGSWFEISIIALIEKIQTDFSKLDGVVNRKN